MTKDSKYEYIKVFAMLMIVCHHFVAKNTFNIDTDVTGVTLNKLILQFLGNNAFIGNNLFFMVSSWFLCVVTPKISITDSLKKIWKLDHLMIFYSIGIVICFYIFDNQQYINSGG